MDIMYILPFWIGSWRAVLVGGSHRSARRGPKVSAASRLRLAPVGRDQSMLCELGVLEKSLLSIYSIQHIICSI